MSNRTTKIVGAGIAPLAAAMIAGDLQTGVTAAGTTQATATVAYGDNIIVTTCPANAGIVLSGPAFGPGDEVMVSNQGANALAVYPPVGGAINGQAANTAVFVNPGQALTLRSVGANVFYALNALAGLPQTKYGAATNTAAFTATGAQFAGAQDVTLNLTGALAGAANITTPTAAQILAAIPNGAVGQSYRLRIINSSGGAFAWTVVADASVTLTGTASIAQNTWRDFYVTVLTATTASMQAIGTGTQS